MGLVLDQLKLQRHTIVTMDTDLCIAFLGFDACPVAHSVSANLDAPVTNPDDKTWLLTATSSAHL